MLIAAAVCPNPPVLVPELAGGLASDLDTLRAACSTAVDRLYEAAPDVLVIVGAADQPSVASRGSFQVYGHALPVDGGWSSSATDAAEPTGSDNPTEMPLSMLVAAWLLRDRPSTPPRRAVGVPEDADALALGRELAAGDQRMAMLVMGDGSACRSPQAPGHFDPRAEDLDAAVAKALAAADARALAALDPALSRELRAAGRGAWQVLAGAAATADRGLGRQLLYSHVAYRAGYFAAARSARSQPACQRADDPSQ